MRTHLTIDDDVVAAAQGLAAREHKMLGVVTSALSRQALRPKAVGRKGRDSVSL